MSEPDMRAAIIIGILITVVGFALFWSSDSGDSSAGVIKVVTSAAKLRAEKATADSLALVTDYQTNTAQIKSDIADAIRGGQRRQAQSIIQKYAVASAGDLESLYNAFRELPMDAKRPPPTVSCRSAGSLIQEKLESGLDGDRLYLGAAVAVRSGVHKRANFVAARIFGPALEDGPIGVWLISGTLSEPGTHLAVNAFAREFSVFPDAGFMALADQEAREAERCFR